MNGGGVQCPPPAVVLAVGERPETRASSPRPRQFHAEHHEVADPEPEPAVQAPPPPKGTAVQP
jgi:hypothetical protein